MITLSKEWSLSFQSHRGGNRDAPRRRRWSAPRCSRCSRPLPRPSGGSTDLSEVPAYSTQSIVIAATDKAFVSAAQECSDEPRDLPINEFTDHRELGIELDRIERISDGKVDVQQIGMSDRGREVEYKVGGPQGGY